MYFCNLALSMAAWRAALRASLPAALLASRLSSSSQRASRRAMRKARFSSRSDMYVVSAASWVGPGSPIVIPANELESLTDKESNVSRDPRSGRG